MRWSIFCIYLIKWNGPILENLNLILQGVLSSVLKSGYNAHLERLLIIKELTTFFLLIYHYMKQVIEVCPYVTCSVRSLNVFMFHFLLSTTSAFLETELVCSNQLG